MGYLPQAMINFLALLGWSPGSDQEIFSLEELAAGFDIGRIQTSPAVFDQAKLDSINGQHIRALDPPALAAALRPFVPDLSDELLLAATPLVQERIQRLTEAGTLLRFLAERPSELPPDLVPKLKEASEEQRIEQTVAVLQDVRRLFSTEPLGPGLEEALRQIARAHGWKAGDVFMSTRVALTGSRVTPPLLESAALLGEEECLLRLDHAINQLSGPRAALPTAGPATPDAAEAPRSAGP
jgi:glutamyl-tRNA synthetase